ncbi:MAG TPA: hypothetical protein VGS22_02510 [Thermoanaerobaculia bacterium]|jgi:hypothetical protein|nr:hypothetical protein [Thermoanaerobaculia bacterium]
MTRSYKKQRLGPRLVEAARSGARWRDLHAIIGGTGAVGGTALLQMLSMYEEMMTMATPGADDVPILLATGLGRDDIRAFTRRLFRTLETRHGVERHPRKIGAGYLTASGVFVAFERFRLTALPGLGAIQDVPADQRRAFVRTFIKGLATGGGRAPIATLLAAIGKARPVATFLRGYLDKHFEGQEAPGRFRSVILGIPIPSLIAYHQDHLKQVLSHIDVSMTDAQDELQEAFVHAFRDDLAEVRGLADEVLIAHTTAVGGMYDESAEEDGKRRSIRLGFAHSAKDEFLVDKQRFAEELAREYGQLGVKILITAAAIGIDEVRLREPIPLHGRPSRLIQDAAEDIFPGAKRPGPDGKPLRHMVRVAPPLTLPLEDPPAGPVHFAAGEMLRPAYSIRSGENGFFSVANADALYRVMRVASASELALVLASVGVLGDDANAPWFPAAENNVCYYTETDNARQVFDLLNQPPLLAAQLSGLEPMALQDLGSAKHQGELHALSLLILLHRLRTVDIDAIDPYVELERFDPERFLLDHSRPLTFEDLAHWPFADLARDMQILVGADSEEDLAPLNPGRHGGLFPKKNQAQSLIFRRALEAVWAIPSLGSPIVFERDGTTLVRTGFFVAPFEILCDRSERIAEHIAQSHAGGSGGSLADFRDFHLATGGFVDLRPGAILVTARTDREDLSSRVVRCRDESELLAAIDRIEPYSFFATCGLAALTARLGALYVELREAMLELGSLQDFRWQMPRDDNGHILVVPGVVEAFRMVSEGLEKTTGTERLDGLWGYRRRAVPVRWDAIPGLPSNGSET